MFHAKCAATYDVPIRENKLMDRFLKPLRRGRAANITILAFEA